MLKKLYIKDYAIVDELSVDFYQGFQIITGETGAGKSILVGAISLLCGERGDNDLIRSGKNKAIIEGEFSKINQPVIIHLLESWDISITSGVLLLRRELNLKSINRSFINDTPVSLSKLSVLSTYLIDLHGQHQHQRLLYTENHINYLDAYGGLNSVLKSYVEKYKEYMQKCSILEQFKQSQKEAHEREELTRFQLQELGQADLKENELVSIQSERKILENSELLFEVTKEVSEILYSASESSLNHIAQALKNIKKLSEIDPEFNKYTETLESARIAIEETGMYCSKYGDSLNFDPVRLNELRERENQIEWLLKKYHRQDVNQLIELQRDFKNQIEQLTNEEDNIIKLQNEIEKLLEDLVKFAFDLSSMRKEIAKNFITEINCLLETVGLQKANFDISITWRENKSGLVNFKNKKYLLDQNGLDSVEFLIGINPGEPLRPLHKIASGGEISRIMLSLKSLLATVDKIPTLVFDEIDTGISGGIAQTVGTRLKSIGKEHQLIVISHLP